MEYNNLYLIYHKTNIITLELLNHVHLIKLILLYLKFSVGIGIIKHVNLVIIYIVNVMPVMDVDLVKMDSNYYKM